MLIVAEADEKPAYHFSLSISPSKAFVIMHGPACLALGGKGDDVTPIVQLL